jgi:hypothetical protein
MRFSIRRSSSFASISQRFTSRTGRLAIALVFALPTIGCGRSALLSTDALPLKRVVLYRNGVGYFERSGHVDEQEVRFKMRDTEVGDFLASLAVIEQGGSSVKAAAFPVQDPYEDTSDDTPKPRSLMTEDEKRGLKIVVLSLDGKEHDLQVGYIAAAPVWRPSYRLVVHPGGDADLQAWGIVQNLSGEDWKDVHLSLVAGAPLSFEADLGTPVIPNRPTVTDNGEVIAALPQTETSLRQSPENAPAPAAASTPASPVAQQEVAADRDGDGIPDAEDAEPDQPSAQKSLGADKKKGNARHAAPKRPSMIAGLGGGGPGAASAGAARYYPPADVPAPPPPPRSISAPRNVNALAAVAVEGGTTRYDLPTAVTVPDKSATMVMLLSQKVVGEAIFLFAPDGGVPDSMSHPFRVARFANGTRGVLERGPIAVFEEGSFLGQGMVDPLPIGASTTVPFALERGLAVDRESKFDERGARVAQIENSQLVIERDAVTQTTYRLRNGLDLPAKTLVKHPRASGTKLFQPPKGTEDNVGTGSALIPSTVAPHATANLVVDERATNRRNEDWFTPVADEAVKAFMKDSRSSRDTVQKLSIAWQVRADILVKADARSKLAQEQNDLQEQTQETRQNLIAIEKNKQADALRTKLTQRLAASATRLDEIQKQVVELDAKLAELRVQFREGIRDIKVEQPPVPPP